jgi:uncharacterized protein GlcG (DUF336 family)
VLTLGKGEEMLAFLQQKSISSDLAKKMIDKAVQKAEELGVKVNIAIVDQGGNLKSFFRMDEAPLLSIQIAQNKAYTAAAFGIPTHQWYDMIKDEPSLRLGIVHTEKLVVFGGGYPIYDGNDLAGGIGVSGGSEEEDRLCCEAALSLLETL